ncbi:MAG: hypothetical protein DRI69_07870 [Bacteroidetes bacterium]|nr:MAG: hypothetical protein DRI69_07870 [Bacteroidota bacterium]
MGAEINLNELLVTSMIFAGLLVIVAGIAHIIIMKMRGVKVFTDRKLSVNQNRSFKSTLSKNELIDKLKTDQFFGRMKLSEKDDNIAIRTRVTFWTWGENIVIKTKELNDNLFEYSISSKPWLPTTLIDYGKNFKNVSRLEELIEPVS